jgi:hypothetical protein
MVLTKLYDFISVLYSTRKHWVKNEYFTMHNLFSTIYLLQEQKLIPNKYSQQEINMSNFVQANGYHMSMHRKIQY